MTENEVVAFFSAYDHFDKIEMVPPIIRPDQDAPPPGTMLLRMVAFDHKSIAVYVRPQDMTVEKLRVMAGDIHMELQRNVFSEFVAQWRAMKAQEVANEDAGQIIKPNGPVGLAGNKESK